MLFFARRLSVGFKLFDEDFKAFYENKNEKKAKDAACSKQKSGFSYAAFKEAYENGNGRQIER